ncbi:hypothetical protein [Paenibacillus sp. NEAU-GSW1]|uniref:hypothetical protein n=1 Tax=Paenibacillus sp. NEAU-GSW1 TaxID=2682486 RepID=UPI0012E30328|nr:hypothetical protein [Paenibacillus sp. NEAU-GSW1]MUT65235.1 hypothetical protein [Paenibacillus sp. NEAU-GSW1]
MPDATYRCNNSYFSWIVFIGEALRLGAFDLAVNARAVQIRFEQDRVFGVQVMAPDKSPAVLPIKK